jgi:TolB-like protein/thioredoxin-like negative regulator of GroEL
MDEAGDLESLPGAIAPGRQCRVFISYASHDVTLAQMVCSALEGAGFACWIAPRNVVPGTQYADGIVHAIDESSILVLILSAQAVASAHVGREIERAVSKRHPVVALRIDAAPLTAAFEYFLNQSQWIEGAGSDAAIAQLVSAVGQHLAPGSAAAPTDANHASAGHRKMAVGRRVWVIAAVVAVLLAGGYFLDKPWRSKHETTATAVISDKSIAVLPFVDMSEKKDQEYFADGMAEEIIDLLVKVPRLKVIARTSSFQFKGRTEDLRSIATQLGVAYVLQGSVRKSGDRLRVTAQLISAQDGTHLWSQTYDRDLSDVLKMQDEIALALVRALQIEVGARELGSRPALRNTEAYTLYLQGLHADDRFDARGFEEAVSYFQRATALDPSSADAEFWLGNAYFGLGLYGFMPPAIAFEKARLATERALTLDPNFARAHAQLGDIHRAYDWDWPAADREVKKAMALAPNDGNILFYAAVQSLGLGRCDDALEQLIASLAQDPLGSFRYFALSKIQSCRGRLAEAEEAQRRSLELRPTSAGGHYYLGQVLVARGQLEAALAEMLKETQDNIRFGGSAMVYFAMGRKTDSDAALAQMLKSDADRHPFRIAQVYAFRGETDEALKWLDRAYVQKEGGGLPVIKTDIAFKKLEGDPRYKAFLRKMNLPE